MYHTYLYSHMHKSVTARHPQMGRNSIWIVRQPKMLRRNEENMGILMAEANAADVAAGQGMGSLVGTFLMCIAWIVIIYFLMFRPQKKEQKRLTAMLADLAPGDCVLTTSGFYGIVIDISDEDGTVIVEFGNNKNCRIPMEKSAISRVEKAEA